MLRVFHSTDWILRNIFTLDERDLGSIKLREM